MKSLYQNKEFAGYWDERAGNSGEVYKRFVLDPAMFKLVGNLKNKVVLELGCGNGYLVKKFIAQNPRKVILMDISEYNLNYAKEKCSDKRIVFLEQDATKQWKVNSNSVDVIYSVMMLNEVADIKTPTQEAFRVLKKNGIFTFAVVHPSWALFVYAQEKVGIKPKKFAGLKNYFHRGYSKYIMGVDNKARPLLAEKYKKEFEVEHYQRPFSDYFNQLTKDGFAVKKIVEPEITKKLLKVAPRFSEKLDYPMGLIFHCLK
ncbi:MAG: class I SAM-dependent methyltransferase [Candidatus Pacebacteria bacterium]|nr:class I SAM-dependent methyltransferase [Candidatus Paceibacterota bacterium]